MRHLIKIFSLPFPASSCHYSPSFSSELSILKNGCEGVGDRDRQNPADKSDQNFLRPLSAAGLMLTQCPDNQDSQRNPNNSPDKRDTEEEQKGIPNVGGMNSNQQHIFIHFFYATKVDFLPNWGPSKKKQISICVLKFFQE